MKGEQEEEEQGQKAKTEENKGPVNGLLDHV